MPRQFKSAGEIVEETSQPEGSGVLGASGGVRRNRGGHRDLTDVTEAEARGLKTATGVSVKERLDNGWSLAWENSAEVGNKAFGYDTVEATKENGCEVVFTPDDTLYKRYDVTAVLRPPDYMKEYEQEQKEAAAAYLAAGEEDGPGFPGQFDERRLSKAATKRQSEQNRASGMIDSTHGMTLQEGLQKFSPRDREEMMERYRRGARHESMDERRAAQADIHRQNAERGGGRKSFAMGAGFDENGRIVR